MSPYSWEVHIHGSACPSAAVIDKAPLRERLHKKPLLMHSDKRSPRQSTILFVKLYELGISPHTSWPIVSVDNAQSEMLIKTLKYIPKIPSGELARVENCQDWTKRFVQFYNYEHRHQGTTRVPPCSATREPSCRNREREN
jgi:transposase InsO family protein